MGHWAAIQRDQDDTAGIALCLLQVGGGSRLRRAIGIRDKNEDYVILVNYSTTSKEGTSGLRTGFFKFFESQEVGGLCTRAVFGVDEKRASHEYRGSRTRIPCIEKKIVVKEWDPEIEDLRDGSELDPDQVERYKLSTCASYRPPITSTNLA